MRSRLCSARSATALHARGAVQFIWFWRTERNAGRSKVGSFMSAAVVITGLGAVSPLGSTFEEHFSRLRGGCSGIVPRPGQDDGQDGDGFPASWAPAQQSGLMERIQ